LKPQRPGLRPGVGLRRRVRTRPRRRAPGALRHHGARSPARLPNARPHLRRWRTCEAAQLAARDELYKKN